MKKFALVQNNRVESVYVCASSDCLPPLRAGQTLQEINEKIRIGDFMQQAVREIIVSPPKARVFPVPIQLHSAEILPLLKKQEKKFLFYAKIIVTTFIALTVVYLLINRG